MAKLSARMSRSGAKRRAEPIRHQIMEIVNLVECQQEEVLVEVIAQCERGSRNAQARQNAGRASLLQALADTLQSYRISVQWTIIPAPVEDAEGEPDPITLRPPPVHRVQWPAEGE
jgi:hypothetical protein